MPLLLLEDIAPRILVGLWYVEESEAWFLEQLSLSQIERAEFQRIQAAGRRLEWLASRHLVKLLAWDQGLQYVFQKDGYGKPHLLYSGRHVSISHSNGWSGAMLAPMPCGMDIQKRVDKIGRLAPKFLNPPEIEYLDEAHRIEHLHVLWGAKEALYKAYGRRRLDFREHIYVQPFALSLQGGTCQGHIHKDDVEWRYHIQYRFLGDFTLVEAYQC